MEQRVRGTSKPSAIDRIAKAQASLQLLAIASAQPEPGLIVEPHIVFAVCTELQPFDSIEINDSRTVNTAKERLIQLSLEF